MPPDNGPPWLAGRYELQQTLASDGSRKVWRALDHLLERVVVIKGVFSDGDEPALREEFFRLRRFAHPRVARTFDLERTAAPPGSPAGRSLLFFTQEWLSGPSLKELRGRLSPSEVRRCLLDTLYTVAFFHHRGLTRLDLKPAHLIRGDSGWRLIDLDQARPDDPLTGGGLHGTLAYMAPEILAGGSVGPCSDLYSLGAIVFEALAGHPPPLQGRTLEEVRQWLPVSPAPDLPEKISLEAPELAALAHALLARDPSQRPASAEEVLAWLCDDRSADWHISSPLPEGELVGRNTVLAQLEAIERSARVEQGGAVVVSAPAGGGRSRLLTELADRWQAADRPALRLNTRSQPVHPLGSVFVLWRHLERLVHPRLPAEPALPATPAGALAEDARETSVSWALSLLIASGRAAAARAGSPIPVLLDDPEALDDLSSAVFRRLLLFLPDSGLLLVIACREPDGWTCHTPALTKVSLPPLSLEEVRLLAEDVLGPGALDSGDEVAHLRRATDGLPGWLRDALTIRWRNPGASLLDWSPADRERLVEAILSPLPAELARVARAAAVFDQPFTPSLLAAILPGEGGRPEPLLEAGLLVSQPDPEGEECFLRFSGEPVRRALEAALPDAHRRELHQRVAEALEQQLFLQHRGRPSTVSRHFLAAGLPLRARPYLQRAVDEARESLNFNEAAGYLRELIRMCPDADATRSDLYRHLSEIENALGHHEAALAALDAALETGALLSPARRARCAAEQGLALLQLGRLAQAAGRLEAALAELPGGPATQPLRTSVMQRLAWIAMEQQDLARAGEALRQVRSEGLPPDSRPAVDQAHLEASLALRIGGPPGSLRQELEAALALAGRLGYARGEIKVLNCLAQVCRLEGDTEATRACLEQVIQRTREGFDLLREASAVHNLGVFLREAGDFSGALELFQLAARLNLRLGNRAREVQNTLSAIALMLNHGRLDRARLELQRAGELLATLPESAIAPRLAWKLLDARLARLSHELEGLDARLASLQEEMEAGRMTSLALEVVVDRMALALLEDRPREALAHYARIAGLPRRDEDHDTWRRVHELSIEAHTRLAPRAMRTGRSPEAPAPPASNGGPADPSRPTGASGPVDAGGASSPGEVARPTAASSSAHPPASSTSRLQESPALSRLEASISPAPWLQRVSRLLHVAQEDELLAAELATLAGEMLHGRGLVLLFDGTGPQVVRSFGMQADQVDDLSNTVIERVRTRRKPYVCPDILVDPEVGSMRSLREASVRSVLCYPVLRDGACIGVLYVDHREVGRVSEGEAVTVMRQIAELAGDLLAAIARRRRVIDREPESFGLVGASEPMLRLKARLADLARSTDPDMVVLLLGETGTGKSIIARSLHQHGNRSSGPFVVVNSAAIPETLFASLMFGYVKGAFSGAVESRPGWFEMARSGMLFLDEIGEMPVAQQAGLLETLGGNRRFRRLGDTREQEFDAHLVCATTRDLKAEVVASRFRAELLRRIQVNTLRVPPLRERGPEDIRLLAGYMIGRYLVQQKLRPAESLPERLEDFFTRRAQELLYQHPWPWNVAEMENLFRSERIRGYLRTLGQQKVDLQELEEVLDEVPLPTGEHGLPAPIVSTSGQDTFQLPRGMTYREFDTWCDELKGRYVRRVHLECGENVRKTARKLGCSRDVVYKYLEGTLS